MDTRTRPQSHAVLSENDTQPSPGRHAPPARGAQPGGGPEGRQQQLTHLLPIAVPDRPCKQTARGGDDSRPRGQREKIKLSVSSTRFTLQSMSKLQKLFEKNQVVSSRKGGMLSRVGKTRENVDAFDYFFLWLWELKLLSVTNFLARENTTELMASNQCQKSLGCYGALCSNGPEARARKPVASCEIIFNTKIWHSAPSAQRSPKNAPKNVADF